MTPPSNLYLEVLAVGPIPPDGRCLHHLSTPDHPVLEVAAHTVQQFSAHPALAPGIGRSIVPGAITFDHAAQSLMPKDQSLVDIGIGSTKTLAKLANEKGWIAVAAI